MGVSSLKAFKYFIEKGLISRKEIEKKLTSTGLDSDQLQFMSDSDLAVLAQDEFNTNELRNMIPYSELNEDDKALLDGWEKIQEEEIQEYPDESDFNIKDEDILPDDVYINETGTAPEADAIASNGNDNDTASNEPEYNATKSLTTDDIDGYKKIYYLKKDMYQDEDIMRIVDEDKDGKLSKEEKAKFENYIQQDKDRLELDDIKDTLKQIKDPKTYGKFDKEDYKNFIVEDISESDKEDVSDKENETEKTDSSASSDSSGGVGGSSGYSSSSGSGATIPEVQKYDENGKPILENMNADELKGVLSEAGQTYQEKQQELRDAQLSTSDKMDKAKEEADELYQLYEDAVREKGEKEEEYKELADNMQSKKAEIEEKEKEINNKEADITIQEANISIYETAYNNANSTVTSLEARLTELENANEDGKLDDKISSLKQEIENAKTERDNAKKELDNVKEELETMKQEKEALQEELKALQSEFEQLQQQASENEDENSPINEAKKAWEAKQDEYEQAKDEFETQKQKNIETAKTNLTESKDYFNKVQTAYNEAVTQEKLNSQYLLSILPEGLFDKDGSYLQGQEDVICKLCDKYNLDPVFVAAIIAVESSWGRSELAAHNNFMGYSKAGDAGADGRGFGYFSSVEAGLDVTIGNLSRYNERYPNEIKSVDINNVYAIQSHYCPSGGWADLVVEIYNQIKEKMN